MLVPPDAVSRTEGGDELLTIRTANARDATHADLARGGYVRDDDTRAGLRDALRARERAELDALAELDEQRARAEKAERELADLRPAPRGMTVREAARARHALGGPDAQMLEGALVQAEREREEAKARGDNMIDVASERANTIDVLRTEIAEASKALLLAGCGSALPLAARVAMLVDERAGILADLRGAKELARVLEVERDTLRAELARLTVPGEGEPTDEELRAVHGRACGGATADGDARALCVARRALFRAGVAHERARQQPRDRATDEELVAIAIDAWTNEPGFIHAALRATALRVAARVRPERCLVAQAVADPLLDSVSVGAVMGGGIRVRIVRRVDSLANTLGETKDVFCERAEVPATLARLLGEVSR